ncbi:alpha/beta-hydrolase [Xylariaceae sp. FL1272]|nr:alpha/beta-hydrolase [Xylariaceae sp. FL1272]
MTRSTTMKWFLAFLGLLASVSWNDASCNASRSVYGFDNIKPSANLTWTPCFEDFNCAKMEVPIDYANKSLGTTSIAFIKLAGKNATTESQSIVIIPGGPGGSGVDLLISERDVVGPALGEQYNFVSFDPRGVNNSGLVVDCFSGNTEAKQAFVELHRTGITNISSTSLEEQYYSSSIFGEWCNNAVENEQPHGYYVSTPTVAHDLLTFIEAEAEEGGRPTTDAKLWCYGISYGTAIGTTFASMFPDRVGRMVLDGVINTEQYYTNNWTDNVDLMDETIERFSGLCHSAGPETCPFWGSTAANITARLDAIIQELEHHPTPRSGAQADELPALVTCSDLKAVLLNAIYYPLVVFPEMAKILYQLEAGDATLLANSYRSLDLSTAHSGVVIRCVDSYRRNSLTTIEDFEDYVEYTTSKSKYIGDIWPIYLDNILCRSFKPNLPESMMIQDPTLKSNTSTSFPILFASNTIDGITPLKSARTMSSRFPGSVLLLQEAVGHTVINQRASTCYFYYVQAYFQGVVPPSNTTCSQEYFPFLDSGL